jgi:hypothetical protein
MAPELKDRATAVGCSLVRPACSWLWRPPIFSSPAANSAGSQERTLVFLGSMKGDADSRIKLIVRQEIMPGSNRNIRVQVRANFSQACTDGSQITRGASGSAPSTTADGFRDDEYYEIEYSDDVYLSYKGRLLGSGDARGWLSGRYDAFSRPSLTARPVADFDGGPSRRGDYR